MRVYAGFALFGLALAIGWLGHRRRSRALNYCGQALGWSAVAVGDDGFFAWTAAVLAVWTAADAWVTFRGTGARKTSKYA